VGFAALATAADLDSDPLATLAKLVQEKKKQVPPETARNQPKTESGRSRNTGENKYQEHRKQSRKTEEQLNNEKAKQQHQNSANPKRDMSEDKGRKNDIPERPQQEGQLSKGKNSKTGAEADQLIKVGTQARKEEQLIKDQESRNRNLHEANKQAEGQTSKATAVIERNNMPNMSTRDRRRGITSSTEKVSNDGSTDYKMTEASRFEADNIDNSDKWMDDKPGDAYRYNRESFGGSSKLNINNIGSSRLNSDNMDSSRQSSNKIGSLRSSLDLINLPKHSMERTGHQLTMTANTENIDNMHGFHVVTKSSKLYTEHNYEPVQSHRETPVASLKAVEWPAAEAEVDVEEDNKQRQGRRQENEDFLTVSRNKVISRGGRKSTRILAKNPGNIYIVLFDCGKDYIRKGI
jgi:hypothetical protein